MTSKTNRGKSEGHVGNRKVNEILNEGNKIAILTHNGDQYITNIVHHSLESAKFL